MLFGILLVVVVVLVMKSKKAKRARQEEDAERVRVEQALDRAELEALEADYLAAKQVSTEQLELEAEAYELAKAEALEVSDELARAENDIEVYNAEVVATAKRLLDKPTFMLEVAGAYYRRSDISKAYQARRKLETKGIKSDAQVSEKYPVIRTDQIELVRDPNNEYDENAIEINVDGVLFGYIESGKTGQPRVVDLLNNQEAYKLELVYIPGLKVGSKGKGAAIQAVEVTELYVTKRSKA